MAHRMPRSSVCSAGVGPVRPRGRAAVRAYTTAGLQGRARAERPPQSRVGREGEWLQASAGGHREGMPIGSERHE